jgi:hypothetical protein
MDISVEYPFIMFLVVFESVLILLLTAFSSQIYIEGLGTFPSYYNLDRPISLLGFNISFGSFIDKTINLCAYVFDLFVFFFKLLILPNIPIEFRFLTIIVFTPLTIVFGWIILKTIIPLLQSLIGIIP